MRINACNYWGQEKKSNNNSKKKSIISFYLDGGWAQDYILVSFFVCLSAKGTTTTETKRSVIAMDFLLSVHADQLEISFRLSWTSRAEGECLIRLIHHAIMRAHTLPPILANPTTDPTVYCEARRLTNIFNSGGGFIHKKVGFHEGGEFSNVPT